MATKTLDNQSGSGAGRKAPAADASVVAHGSDQWAEDLAWVKQELKKAKYRRDAMEQAEAEVSMYIAYGEIQAFRSVKRRLRAKIRAHNASTRAAGRATS